MGWSKSGRRCRDGSGNSGAASPKTAATASSISARRYVDARRSMQRKQRRFERYGELMKALGLFAADSVGAFLILRQKCAAMLEEEAEIEARIQNELNEAGVEFRLKREEHDRLLVEITGLKARRSQYRRKADRHPPYPVHRPGACRKRDALYRRAAPGAGRRARLGRRHRTAAARLRPVASGAGRRYTPGRRVGGQHTT